MQTSCLRSDFMFLPAVNNEYACAGYASPAAGEHSSPAAEPAQRQSRAMHGPLHDMPALGAGRPWKRSAHGAALRARPPRSRQGLCELCGRAWQGEHAARRQHGARPAAGARLAAQQGFRPGCCAAAGPRQRRTTRAQSAWPPGARRPRRGRRGWAGGGARPPGCAARRAGGRWLARRKYAPRARGSVGQRPARDRRGPCGSSAGAPRLAQRGAAP